MKPGAGVRDIDDEEKLKSREREMIPYLTSANTGEVGLHQEALAREPLHARRRALETDLQVATAQMKEVVM